MAGFVFNRGSFRLLSGATVWTTSPIWARLVNTAAAALDPDADVMTGIGSTEATAEAIIDTPVGPTIDDVNDRVVFTSADQVFPSASAVIGECDRMVFYHKVTNDADSVPIACVEITPVTPNNGDLNVEMDPDGWFYAELGAGASMVENLYEYSYTLNNTQIKALPTSGYQILPSPGSGKIWSVIQVDLVLNATAGAYTNITDTAYLELSHLSSDNLVDDASIGYTQLTDLFGTASVNYGCMKGHFSSEADSTYAAFTGYGNTTKVIKAVSADDNAAVSLNFTGNTGDLTGGNAANTLKIRVLAMKIDL